MMARCSVLGRPKILLEASTVSCPRAIGTDVIFSADRKNAKTASALCASCSRNAASTSPTRARRCRSRVAASAAASERAAANSPRASPRPPSSPELATEPASHARWSTFPPGPVLSSSHSPRIQVRPNLALDPLQGVVHGLCVAAKPLADLLVGVAVEVQREHAALEL
jgi:hypothetical protein